LLKYNPLIGEKMYVSKNSMYTNLPIILLVNEYTFSGAELFAMALKHNNRAILVGTKTGGRGDVQSLIPFRNLFTIKLTTGYLFSPLNSPIEKLGVTPNVIESEPSDYSQLVFPNKYIDDYKTIKDNQLQIALKEAIKIVNKPHK
jgi:C-terminal processing protease CtpA/Prc